jgi:methyl-accepting chemotaxis protein
LFFICASERGLIEAAGSEKARASALLEELQKTMNNVKENTSALDHDITDCYSKQLADVSRYASGIVAQGSEKINHMDKQMNIISSSVTESLSTVQELQSNMDKVNTFLSGIEQIAEQSFHEAFLTHFGTITI